MTVIYSYPFNTTIPTRIAVDRKATTHQIAIKSGTMMVSLVPPGGTPIPDSTVISPATAYAVTGRYDFIDLIPTGTVVGEIVSS